MRRRGGEIEETEITVVFLNLRDGMVDKAASPSPHLSEKCSTNRGYDELGNSLLPQLALFLLRPAVWSGIAGEEWFQSWTKTDVVSGLCSTCCMHRWSSAAKKDEWLG